MITKIYSAALQGVDAVEVEVELNARKCENPRTVIVGLPDAAVRESGERAAIRDRPAAINHHAAIKPTPTTSGESPESSPNRSISEQSDLSPENRPEKLVDLVNL